MHHDSLSVLYFDLVVVQRLEIFSSRGLTRVTRSLPQPLSLGFQIIMMHMKSSLRLKSKPCVLLGSAYPQMPSQLTAGSAVTYVLHMHLRLVYGNGRR